MAQHQFSCILWSCRCTCTITHVLTYCLRFHIFIRIRDYTWWTRDALLITKRCYDTVKWQWSVSSLFCAKGKHKFFFFCIAIVNVHESSKRQCVRYRYILLLLMLRLILSVIVFHTMCLYNIWIFTLYNVLLEQQ